MEGKVKTRNIIITLIRILISSLLVMCVVTYTKTIIPHSLYTFVALNLNQDTKAIPTLQLQDPLQADRRVLPTVRVHVWEG